MTPEQECKILKKVRIKCHETIILRLLPVLPTERYFIDRDKVFKLTVDHLELSSLLNYNHVTNPYPNTLLIRDIVGTISDKELPDTSEIMVFGTYKRFDFIQDVALFLENTYETKEEALKAIKLTNEYKSVMVRKYRERLYAVLCVVYLLIITTLVYHIWYPLAGIIVLLPFIIRYLVKITYGD